MRGPTSAFDTLHNYLSARGAAFSDEERTILDGAFVPTSLAAGAFFQRAGEPATQAAFVASGCMRIYVVDARGKEHILQFLPEDWWWSDTLSLTTGAPSQYFAQAIEGTDLLCIDPPSHQRLLDELPAFAASFRAGIQRHNAAKDQRIVSTLSATAEERYTAFVATYPSIVQRVPQWMLASYLGVSPETVSRIRKSRSRKAGEKRPRAGRT
jgi:CRP-like cAMP-binding protein